VRIIAGSRKGSRIFAPKGTETRPTGDRVREALGDLIDDPLIDDAWPHARRAAAVTRCSGGREEAWALRCDARPCSSCG